MQLRTLMYAAQENRADIRERVQEIVKTYHPITDESHVEKDAVYESLIEEKE